MSGECETCGEHILDCSCEIIEKSTSQNPRHTLGLVSKPLRDMDTCDRYQLHEEYKSMVKDMLFRFAHQFLLEISHGEEDEPLNIKEFCDHWVEDHIRIAKCD